MLLYVHIPFCESKCPYCAFGSVVGKRNLTSAYFDAMIADFREQILKFDVSQGAQNRQRSGKTEVSKQNSGEFDDTSEQTAKPNLTTKNAQISQNLNRKNIKNAAVNQKKAGLNLANPNLNTKECGKIETVFIGGGTPSAVDAGYYERLFETVAPYLATNAEITTEANPNSASKKWLSQMKSYGINRISFGAQSFFEDKLKFLGRIHDARQIYEAVASAKTAGLENINVDLIYGTKLDTKKRLEQEAQNVRNLGVSHVSAYSLTLEENTPFAGKINYAKDSPRLAKFMIDRIEETGLKQYEISNFGQICKHNLGYWQGKNYLALGAYAVGFWRDHRFYNASNLNAYVKNPHAKKIENLSADELNLERIFLGARSIVGIEQNSLNAEQEQRARLLKNSGKLKFKNGRYYAKNFLTADEISLFIAG